MQTKYSKYNELYQCDEVFSAEKVVSVYDYETNTHRDRVCFEIRRVGSKRLQEPHGVGIMWQEDWEKLEDYFWTEVAPLDELAVFMSTALLDFGHQS